MKVISWSEADFKKNLSERLRLAKKLRAEFEDQWELNAAIVNNQYSRPSSVGVSFDSLIELAAEEPDEGDAETGSNYTFKYIRFLHSQMSTNPPSVVVRPNSSESEDKYAADSADRLCRHAYKANRVQEITDQTTLRTLIRGTGWTKVFWDVYGGEALEFNEETNEILMEGAIKMYSPSTLDVWLDDTARSWDEVRYIFERIRVPLEEGQAMFPEKANLLRKVVYGNKESWEETEDKPKENVVEYYVYYEKGCPSNGMAGRYAVCLDDGTLLEAPKKNPHPGAKLPYHILTDIDLEDNIYGKSNVEYVSRNQELLNRFDSAAVDAMQAHGVIRMTAHEDHELNEDTLTNSNYDIVPYSGPVGQPPKFMQPPALPPDMPRIREQLKVDIQEVMGINDAMLGVQKREQSGFSQQTAIEAGNMTRRRLFNKYSAYTEGIFKDYLALVQKHWKTPQKVLVVGKENSFEVKYFTAADLKGGFDLVVEYGAALPIEPSMRRESIMLLMPVLEKAGMDSKTILNLLKLNDLEGVHDTVSMAADRQREIFEEMLEEEKYIAPRELENHLNMLVYCDAFVMTKEYSALKDSQKVLLDQHIKERMELAAKAGSGSAPGAAAPPAPGAPPAGGMPPPPMV